MQVFKGPECNSNFSTASESTFQDLLGALETFFLALSAPHVQSESADSPLEEGGCILPFVPISATPLHLFQGISSCR